MEPSHYRQEMEKLFEYLQGYLKKLNKKGISDDERTEIFKGVGSDGKKFKTGRNDRPSGKLGEIKHFLTQIKADKADSFNSTDKAEFKVVEDWAKAENKKYINQFIKIRQDSERVELLGPGSKGSDPVSNREVASEALRIQKENKNIVGDIITELQETKEIAVNATEMLEEQHETIKNIGAKVLGLRSDVKRAGNLLRQFRRRMMTDKLIVCFLFLIVVGIAFCVVYAAVVPGQDTVYMPDAAKPPTANELEKDYNSITGQTTVAPVTTTTTTAAPGRRLRGVVW